MIEAPATSAPAVSSRRLRAWTAGSRPADLLLLAAAVIAGSVTRHAVYSRPGVVILATAVLIAAAAMRAWAPGSTRPAGPSRAAVLAALGLAALVQIIKPPYLNVAGATWLLRAGVLTCLAATVAGAVLVALPVSRWAVATCWAAVAGTGVGYLLVVRGSTRPLIDVWAILQGASLGVVHGHNPYDMVFTGVPAGQVNDYFNYLPVTFLLPVPARLALGDVRYAEAAALLAGMVALTGWAVHSVNAGGRGGATDISTKQCRAAHPSPTISADDPPRGRPPVALPLAVLAGVLPGALYDVQQAWNETIVAGALVGAAVLLAARRPGWAVACLAVALGTKQHVALLLPLWACWPGLGPRRAAAGVAGAGLVALPWLVAAPGRFWAGAVRFFLDLPARADSLSLWQLLPGPLRTPALLAAVLAGYALVLRWAPRTPAGLLAGSGLILAAFDLLNKQSFLNQWLLVAQLLIGGLALAAAGGHAGQVTASRSGRSAAAAT